MSSTITRTSCSRWWCRRSRKRTAQSPLGPGRARAGGAHRPAAVPVGRDGIGVEPGPPGEARGTRPGYREHSRLPLANLRGRRQVGPRRADPSGRPGGCPRLAGSLNGHDRAGAADRLRLSATSVPARWRWESSYARRHEPCRQCSEWGDPARSRLGAVAGREGGDGTSDDSPALHDARRGRAVAARADGSRGVPGVRRRVSGESPTTRPRNGARA